MICLKSLVENLISYNTLATFTSLQDSSNTVLCANSRDDLERVSKVKTPLKSNRRFNFELLKRLRFNSSEGHEERHAYSIVVKETIFDKRNAHKNHKPVDFIASWKPQIFAPTTPISLSLPLKLNCCPYYNDKNFNPIA